MCLQNSNFGYREKNSPQQRPAQPRATTRTVADGGGAVRQLVEHEVGLLLVQPLDEEQREISKLGFWDVEIFSVGRGGGEFWDDNLNFVGGRR